MVYIPWSDLCWWLDVIHEVKLNMQTPPFVRVARTKREIQGYNNMDWSEGIDHCLFKRSWFRSKKLFCSIGKVEKYVMYVSKLICFEFHLAKAFDWSHCTMLLQFFLALSFGGIDHSHCADILLNTMHNLLC
jgi:hypothetical protein